MTDQQQPSEQIEQLWYMWSDLGLDEIRAGFRIRAVSPGLRDIRSQRVQDLNRYQRYFLPGDVDLTTSIERAPVCLSFVVAERASVLSGKNRAPERQMLTGREVVVQKSHIRSLPKGGELSKQERILVCKTYTGRVGDGRNGAFFVHLLAGLPEQFSAQDAIALWRSSFWKSSDTDLRKKDPWGTHLDFVSPTELQSQSNELTPQQRHAKQIERYLPLVVQSYLLKKLVEEQSAVQAGQQLYLAGTDDEIAQLLMGLIAALPERWKKDLTFSTYEPDVTKARTEIVGTCWLSGTDGEREARSKPLLPASFYREKLALNCYTGEQTSFEQFLAGKRALLQLLQEKQSVFELVGQYATQHFVEGDIALYQALLEHANERDDLSSELFLELAEKILGQQPSRSTLESLFRPKTRAERKFSVQMLSLPNYRGAFLQECLSDHHWWYNVIKPAMSALQRSPEFQPVLTKIAGQVIPMAGATARRETRTQLLKVMAQEERLFTLLQDIMFCADPPQRNSPGWSRLLVELAAIPRIFQFFQKHWSIYSSLMQIWSDVFVISTPADENTLLTLCCTKPPHPNWFEFGDFLALHLPPAWNEVVARFLAAHPPREVNMVKFEPLFHQEIVTFFGQLVRVPQWNQTAVNVFGALVIHGYQQRKALLDILLASPLGKDDGIVLRLLQMARLTPQDQAQFLTHYGPLYLSVQGRHQEIILRMYEELVKSGKSQEKMAVLVSWCDALRMEEPLLTIILSIANLNPVESGQFLQRYGQTCIPLYPTSPQLFNLFSMAAMLPELRFSLLMLWLNQNLKPGIWEQVLQSAGQLPPENRTSMLESSGAIYLQRYPHSATLGKYIWEYLDTLAIADLSPLKADPAQSPFATEQFLRVLNSSAVQLKNPQRVLVHDWCVVGDFLKRPALQPNPEGEKAAESIGRLLVLPAQPETTRQQLLNELASPCLLIIYTADHPIWSSLADILLRSMRFAILNRKCFKERVDQEFFLQQFLDTLLLESEKKTLIALDDATRQWSEEERVIWRHYKDARPLLFIEQTLSRRQRIQFWYEYTTALWRVRRAFKYENQRNLARSGTEYMTTLLNYTRKLPQGCLEAIDRACDQRASEQEQRWLARPALSTPAVHISQPASRPLPSFTENIRAWWEQRETIRWMRETLRSGNLGKIVRVATDNIDLLHTHYKSMPELWWQEIDAAYDLYHAILDAAEESSEKGELAILQAWDIVVDLFKQDHIRPRFTAHEKRRREAALRYINAQHNAAPAKAL